MADIKKNKPTFGRSVEEFLQSRNCISEQNVDLKDEVSIKGSEKTQIDEPTYSKVREAAFSYIGINLRSSGNVRKKLLAKGNPADLVERVIADLIEENYIDDLRLAEEKIRTYRKRDAESRAMRLQRLLRLGIGYEAARKAVAESSQDDRQSVHDYLTSRFYKELNFWYNELALNTNGLPNDFYYRKDVLRVVRNVQRHGFKFSVIKETIENIFFTMGEN